MLRAVFKCLEEDYDDELVKMFYYSVNSCLSKVPWDLLHKFQPCLFDGSYKNSSMYQLNVECLEGSPFLLSLSDRVVISMHY